MKLRDHPTVKRHEARAPVPPPPEVLDAASVRELALEAGADDVGFVELDRPELADQRDDILRAFPRAQALIAFVVRLNREPIRTPARSVANLEFHHTGDRVNEVARDIVGALELQGIQALNPSMGFPMEMDRFPEKIWVVAHKPVAVAAGLGHMGIHRNVIHPRFGNFILLGTVIVDRPISETSQPVDYNPCLECKLCVAACPVGAIKPDGAFNFSACYTHNYREFMSGFTNWAENVADSGSARDYRERVSDQESASMWQSLSFGANYKAAYCLSVCPAGEDVIGPYLEDRPLHLRDVVKPLQEKAEPVYVVAGSDAQDHVAKRFPNKAARVVGNSLRPTSIAGFLDGLPHVFQHGKSKGLEAVYHFTFTGDEEARATVTIRDQRVDVQRGHVGTADLRMQADAGTWLGVLAKERNVVWALIRRRVRIKGPLRLLKAFERCFP